VNMYIINPNNPNEVLKQWANPDGAICATHSGWVTKLALNCPTSGLVSTQVPIIVQYKDWEGNLLADVNDPVTITVDGPGEANQELVLDMLSGQAEFDFISDIPGTFKIKAQTNILCDSVEVEVVIS